MLGDSFTIVPTALKVCRYWPELARQNQLISYDPWVAFHDMRGERISGPMQLIPEKPGGADGQPNRMYRHSRPKFYQILVQQVEKLGIAIEYGKQAVEYREDAEAGEASVVLKNGEVLRATLVVAGDGVGSRSGKLILGEPVPARSSGYAIFRAAWPVELALADPLVKERFQLLENGKSLIEVWVGYVLAHSVSLSRCRRGF